MIRVVIDTNVYISALMFGGLPGSLLDLMFLKSFVTIVSPVLLDELEEKLCLKFEVTAEDAAAVRRKISSVAQVVEPSKAIQAVKQDPDNDRVLECAVAGPADYIVTGDRHLLMLGEYRGTSIIRAREFLDCIK